MWQSYRDEAAWLVQITESGIERAHQAALLAQRGDLAEDLQYTENFGAAIGAIGTIAIERIFGND